jgi:2-iminobutanoate/2-iminopropanoate deaminase
MVVTAAGGSMDDIVSMRIYAPDRSVRDPLNEQWVKAFPDPADRPARHLLVTELTRPALIQCEITAVLEHSPETIR